jgi:ABC-type lipoprotein release transport system permease subunit
MLKKRDTFLSLAWRNIWRNKRRTAITVAAVAFAVILALFSFSIATGEHEQMIRDTLALHTGHIQVHAKGYWEDRTIYNHMVVPDELRLFLQEDERVSAVTERISIDSLISKDDNTSGILLIGVDPENEFSTIKRGRDWRRIDVEEENKITRGTYLSPDDYSGIIIGETLAKNLAADVGDELIVITQSLYGAIAYDRFYVRGVFKSGVQEMDRSMALINIENARYLLFMDGMATELTILLKNSRDLKKFYHDIEELLDPEHYEIMPWQELVPELVQFVEFDNAFGYIYYALILIVVIFGILNTILMAVMERYREFGVLMAIGTKPGEIRKLVLFESAFIAVIGIVIGNILGFFLCYYFTQVPMDLSGYAETFESFGIDPKIYGIIYAWMFYITNGIILASTLLASLYPAIKASRLEPVKALRYI